MIVVLTLGLCTKKVQMGIFNKDNLFLPNAKSRFYPEYFFPDSNKIPIINFEWYEICLRNLKQTRKEVWNPHQPVNAISLVIEFPNVKENIVSRIRGISNLIANKMGLDADPKILQELDGQLYLGGGLAYVEHLSGLMKTGLIHPSVANAISLMKTKIEDSDYFQISHARDKSVEVGYGVTRFSKEPVERFIENLRPLN